MGYYQLSEVFEYGDVLFGQWFVWFLVDDVEVVEVEIFCGGQWSFGVEVDVWFVLYIGVVLEVWVEGGVGYFEDFFVQDCIGVE